MFGELYNEQGQPILAMDYTEDFLYDRRQIAATVTATPYNYFTREGGTDEADTNMTQAGVLPANTEAHVFTIQVVPDQACTLADLKLLMYNGVLRFVRDDDTIMKAPLEMFPAGTGITGFTTANASTTACLGIPNPLAVFTLTKAIWIPPQIAFRVELVFPDAPTLSAATYVRVVMRTLKRTFKV